MFFHIPLMTLPFLLYSLGLAGAFGGPGDAWQAQLFSLRMLSVFVFVAFLVGFLLVERAAGSLFFILTAIALVDLLAGFVVSLRAASRDVNFG